MFFSPVNCGYVYLSNPWQYSPEIFLKVALRTTFKKISGLSVSAKR